MRPIKTALLVLYTLFIITVIIWAGLFLSGAWL